MREDILNYLPTVMFYKFSNINRYASITCKYYIVYTFNSKNVWRVFSTLFWMYTKINVGCSQNSYVLLRIVYFTRSNYSLYH